MTANRKVALFARRVACRRVVLGRPARADNPMGYQLLTPQAAASLPRNQGSLGLDVERAQQITDDGMTFDLIRVRGVRRGSPGAQAGFSPGDQIIAVDGRVFSSLTCSRRISARCRRGRRSASTTSPPMAARRKRSACPLRWAVRAAARRQHRRPQASSGMSTGTKVAIGVGAAALLGCYELGCFSHRRTNQPAPGRMQNPQQGAFQQQVAPQQNGFQQQPR